MIYTGQKLKEEHGEWPCGVCGKGVGRNSIQCTECEKWVHKRCSGIKGLSPKRGGSFAFKRCTKEDQGQNDWWTDRKGAEVSEGMDIGNGVKLERVEKFCYLGDMIAVEGGIDQAVVARIRSGWNRFRQLASFLTAKDISLLDRGRVYNACIRSCMLYGSETWAMSRDNEAS